MSDRNGRPRRHHNVTFALLALAAVSYALLQSLVAPALPGIQNALHTSVNSASWVLTAYLLSASVATPLIGRLGDMYGKERLLVVVLGLLCVATVVSALATTLAVMLVGRVVQGAAGGVFPLSFGIIRDEFPRERVAGAVGVMSALAIAGAQTGRLEKRFGSKPPLLAGASFTASSYLLLALARTERWEMYLASLMLGTGIGLAFAAMVNLIIENVGPTETGVATGMNAVTRTVGGAFGGAAVASILASTVTASRYPSIHGFTVAFSACALALVLGVVVGLAIPQRRPADAFARHEVGDL